MNGYEFDEEPIIKNQNGEAYTIQYFRGKHKNEYVMRTPAGDAILYETSIDDIVKGNGNLQKPCEMPIQRKYIYGKINELGFSKTARQECRFDYVLPLFRKLIPKSIKRTIKKLIYKN